MTTEEFTHLRERGLTQEAAFRGSLVKVRVDTVALPNGETAQREIVEHPGAIAVIPLTAEGRIVLVRQFRYPINQITLELPAGKLELGETPEETCLRELAEETGFTAAALTKLTEFVVAPGYTTERITLFKAEDLTPMVAEHDADEFVETVEVTRAEALAMIQDGRIIDAKTMIGLLWLDREP